jgi:hypothetical protein
MLGGPLDPCDNHVVRSDLPVLASLGLVTWHSHIGPRVAASHWLILKCLDQIGVLSPHSYI